MKQIYAKQSEWTKLLWNIWHDLNVWCDLLLVSRLSRQISIPQEKRESIRPLTNVLVCLFFFSSFIFNDDNQANFISQKTQTITITTPNQHTINHFKCHKNGFVSDSWLWQWFRLVRASIYFDCAAQNGNVSGCIAHFIYSTLHCIFLWPILALRFVSCHFDIGNCAYTTELWWFIVPSERSIIDFQLVRWCKIESIWKIKKEKE